MPDAAPRWLLLLHQIPPSPPYFRAKVLRRLNQIGALAIKNSAYILPENDETNEDIHWLRSEIENEKGEVWLFRVEMLSGLSNASAIRSFHELRSQEYAQLLHESEQLLASACAGAGEPSKLESDRRKLKRRFDEIRRIDFFDAPGRKELEDIMETINRRLQAPESGSAAKPAPNSLTGRTWVTRRGVKVDRIGTAWLIRRFIDAEAAFRFVDPNRYTHAPAEVRFDMFEGEFTHEGDLCTFEVLLHHAGLHDPVLDAIAEVIHDIDLKDDKYQRPETNGIAAQINGIAMLHAGDEARLEDGFRIFEATYAGLKAVSKG